MWTKDIRVFSERDWDKTLFVSSKYRGIVVRGKFDYWIIIRNICGNGRYVVIGLVRCVCTVTYCIDTVCTITSYVKDAQCAV